MKVVSFAPSAFSLGLVGRKATVGGSIVKVDNNAIMKRMKAYISTLDKVSNEALGLAAYTARTILAGAAKGTGKGAEESGNKRNRFNPIYKTLHQGRKPGGILGVAGSRKNPGGPYLVMSTGKDTVEVTIRSKFVRVANKFQDGFPVSENNKRLLMRYSRAKGGYVTNLPWKNKRELRREGYVKPLRPVRLVANPARPMFEPAQRYVKKNFRRMYQSILSKKLSGKIK